MNEREEINKLPQNSQHLNNTSYSAVIRVWYKDHPEIPDRNDFSKSVIVVHR